MVADALLGLLAELLAQSGGQHQLSAGRSPQHDRVLAVLHLVQKLSEDLVPPFSACWHAQARQGD